MKPRFRTLAVLVVCAGIALCVLLFALQSFPDPESLAYLQEMVAEKGWCSVSVAGGDWVIHADTAKIEDESLILKRNAITGGDSCVAITRNSGFPVFAKSVSIRFVRDPNDSLELTLHQVERGNLKAEFMRMTLDRNWSLRKRLAHLCWEVKNVGK